MTARKEGLNESPPLHTKKSENVTISLSCYFYFLSTIHFYLQITPKGLPKTIPDGSLLRVGWEEPPENIEQWLSSILNRMNWKSDRLASPQDFDTVGAKVWMSLLQVMLEINATMMV